MRLWNIEGAEPPELKMYPLSEGYCVIFDNRGMEEAPGSHIIQADKARLLLGNQPLRKDRDMEWALEYKLALAIDSTFVPLVTYEPEIF